MAGCIATGIDTNRPVQACADRIRQTCWLSADTPQIQTSKCHIKISGGLDWVGTRTAVRSQGLGLFVNNVLIPMELLSLAAFRLKCRPLM